MISDVQKVAALLQKDSITTTEYTQHGRFDYRFLLYRFGTWKNVLEQAELCQTKFHHSISEDELLKEIERIWIILGRQPTSGDIKRWNLDILAEYLCAKIWWMEEVLTSFYKLYQ